MRRSRRANMPASVQTALHSAPDELLIFSATFTKSMPRSKFMRRLWMDKISARDCDVGLGNSILRSIRPGRNNALSKMSIRLVAMMTLMFCVASKPSNCANSSNIVRWTSLSPPIESISSMKMMVGAASRAITNNSRTMRDPSPIYFWTNSDPDTRMNVQSVWWATARANNVLPVPGGPYNNTPFGCATPKASKSSGCLIGNSITSLISWICFVRPPTISYVESGTFST
eukprot:gene7080-gene7788